MFSFGIKTLIIYKNFKFQGYFAIKLYTNKVCIPAQNNPAYVGQPAFAYLRWGPLSDKVNSHY
jgi:hypothetical protein